MCRTCNFTNKLKRYRALLKDAQTQIEVLRNDSVSKAQLKQLQAQLEEASAHQQLTKKSKKSIQFENEDLQNQIEEISISKQEVERQLTESLRERFVFHLFLPKSFSKIVGNMGPIFFI